MEEFTPASGVSRRELLAGIGGIASLTVAGCSELGGSGGPEGEGDTIEIFVGNGTDESAMIAVRIENDTGETLFSRVYELGPDKGDESAGIETVPSTVTAFTPEGNAASWEYDPVSDTECDQDIGIRLLPDGSFEYSDGC